MYVTALTAASPRQALPAEGLVCHDVRNPAQRSEVLVRKGRLVPAAELAELLERGIEEIHVAVAAPDDVGEDAAAARLAAAIAGLGVSLGPARFGQVTLSSATRGLLRVRADLLERVNTHPGVLALTSPADCAADVGAPLGVVKCAPLYLSEDIIQSVEALRLSDGAVVSVEPFTPRRVAIIAVEERLRGGAFERATTSLQQALEWYGSSTCGVFAVEATTASVRHGYCQALEGGAELILAASAAATDPLDVMFEGLRQAGGEVLQSGIPAEPGTACWFGRVGDCAVLGLAACELFGRPGALDLLLPRLHAGERLDAALMRRIALGGLLVGGPSRILPYHTAEEV